MVIPSNWSLEMKQAVKQPTVCKTAPQRQLSSHAHHGEVRNPGSPELTCYSDPDFPGGSDGKASVYNEGDLGLIPGSGRSAGEGNGKPLQFYCLENPMDRGAW